MKTSKVHAFLLLCANLLRDNVYEFSSFTIHSTAMARENSFQIFLHDENIAKVVTVLSGMCFPRPVHYDRIFHDNIEYENIFKVFSNAN